MEKQQPRSQTRKYGPSPQVGSAPAARVPAILRPCEMFSMPGSLPELIACSQVGLLKELCPPFAVLCPYHRPGQGSSGGGRNPELGGETK